MLVALSGGADSLALAAATAFEAPRLGFAAGAVVVDHGLQSGSGSVAEQAAEQARGLGLEPVVVRRVDVDPGPEGPEAAARGARYRALVDTAHGAGGGEAALILTAHTRDDQAEQVLLALARGSGSRSIAGIPCERDLGSATVIRPFLAEDPAVSRSVTEAACAAQELRPWHDPHNREPAFARVRVRRRVLPVVERELGPGIAEALARSADLAREDADALEVLAEAAVQRISPESASAEKEGAAVRVPVDALLSEPAAIRHRMIRRIAAVCFDAHLSREHTLSVAALVTAWKGQKAVYVPGMRVTRAGGELLFVRQSGSPRA